MSNHTDPRRVLGTLAAALLVTVVALLALPAAPAQAREYAISRVDIDATVLPDGTLSVAETRTFDFDGSFNGVYWDIPTGHNESNGQDVEVSVLSAGEGTAGDVTALEASDSGANGTYRVERRGDVLRVTLFSAQEDDEVAFTIAYAARGVVTRWSDTGELYWKFVSDGWDVPSDNVTCTLHLPVPSGASVEPGETVRAWGHGPLDAEVAFDGDDVVFTVPGVGTDEFAEMRVAFPSSWVADLAETPGERLPTILSEEQRWADEANERRDRARLAYFGSMAAAAVLAAGSVAWALVRRARYRREAAPRFQDAYFRDVPTSDHPAVLGALHDGGDVDGRQLTASLMRLTDQGVLRLEKVTETRRGLLGEKVEEDYRLTVERELAPAGAGDVRARQARDLDERTLELVFGTVAGTGAQVGASLSFEQIEAFAKREPQAYSDAYDEWEGSVRGAYLTRFSGTGELTRGRGLLYALAVADWAVGALVAVALAVMGAPALAIVVEAAVMAVVGVAVFAVAHGMSDLNREAIEVRAQLDALERWLREFTRLKEAPPTDVVLWNRLLVMAVALGVADEVIEQLKDALPQVIDDPLFMPAYGWFFWYGRGTRAPVAALAHSVESAHNVSAAALAGSSNSSVGGGGGGFSGGGGGGFGGGGGGGAF
ncbi:DUF2207 domain-containing protein [Thermophilibacter sp.]